MTEPSELYRAMARIICAQLIPHRTSVHNVSLLAASLTAAEEKGRREAIEECARIVRDVKAEAAVDAPCVVAGAWRLACAEIDQRIRALADQPAPAAPQPSEAEVEDAVDAGIEAAAEAVSALPPGQKGWDQKEFMIAETAAKAALAAAKVRAR